MKTVIMDALNAIDNSYQELLSVEEIAQRIQCTYNTLRVTFKRIVGSSLIQYLNKTKCSYAAFYLKTTDWKLYKVATEVGFKDEKYFIKIFKKFYGLCPQAYRNKY